MIFTKTSVFSGKANSMELPITEQQYDEWMAYPRHERPFVQHSFPQLNPEQREFLINGVTPDEWLEAFGTEEDS